MIEKKYYDQAHALAFSMLEKNPTRCDADISYETATAQSSVSNWRTGNSIPTLPKMLQILDYFGYELKIVKKGEEAK